MKNYQIILQGAAEAPTGEGFDLVTIIADTAADMPEPDPKWAAGSELYVLELGGSKYRLTNSREWLECSFDVGGGGVTEEYVMQKIAEAQLSESEVDLSAYAPRTEVQEMIKPVSNAAAAAQNTATVAQNTADAAQNAASAAQSTAIAAQSAAAENAEEIETLRQNQAALIAGTVTITRNEEFVTGWNAFHNFRDGNTLFINGNFKIGADIPGGTTLFTLPYKVNWAYMLVKHGNNFFYAIANNNIIYIPSSAEMLKSTSGGATIVGFARITGAADAASEEA